MHSVTKKLEDVDVWVRDAVSVLARWQATARTLLPFVPAKVGTEVPEHLAYAIPARIQELELTLAEVLAMFPPNDIIKILTPTSAMHVRRYPADKSPTAADIYRWREALSRREPVGFRSRPGESRHRRTGKQGDGNG